MPVLSKIYACHRIWTGQENKHTVDERVEIAQIHQLKSIYGRIKTICLIDARVIVMVKAPVAGRVKTRLGCDIGMTNAAWWYRHQTARILRRS